jgi:acyl-CoA synthetase (NDP forming)
VVLKIASTDITHKSDSGGVKVGLGSTAEVISAYDDIMSAVKQKNPGAKIQGVSVQNMAKQGVEVIVGMSKDPQFGAVIMFGLGGVMVEILKDVAFRLIPLAERDAKEMIKEIKGYPLLEGYRGQAPCDIRALEQLLLQISDFVEHNPEVEELDLNPVFAYSDGAVAVDARMVLGVESH